MLRSSESANWILENACKNVRTPGSFNISGRADATHLSLHFEDTGPGVPDEALPRLFDRLYRVEGSRNRNTGGSGLGLSICRHIIDNHNGRIWAENNPLGGLSISIKLPVNDRTIDSHIKNLRKKIAAVLPQIDVIQTIYGVGYKLSY